MRRFSARLRQRRCRDQFRIEAQRRPLRAVASDGQGAGDGLGLEMVAEAGLVAGLVRPARRRRARVWTGACRCVRGCPVAPFLSPGFASVRPCDVPYYRAPDARPPCAAGFIHTLCAPPGSLITLYNPKSRDARP